MGADASSSLPSTLVPPHLGPGRPWEPQGAVAALPQEKPLPRRGGPCLPLLVSIGDTATWVTPPWHHPLPRTLPSASVSAHFLGAPGAAGASSHPAFSPAGPRSPPQWCRSTWSPLRRRRGQWQCQQLLQQSRREAGSWEVRGGPGEDGDPHSAETELAAALGGWWLDVDSHFRLQFEILGYLQPPVTVSLSLTQGQGPSL